MSCDLVFVLYSFSAAVLSLFPDNTDFIYNNEGRFEMG